MAKADDSSEDEAIALVGAAATLNGVPPKGWRPPRREFPPGIAGASPGPSHPEPAAPPRKPVASGPPAIPSGPGSGRRRSA